MHDMFEEILQYLRGVWLKKRYIVIISWLVCICGWMFVATMPDQYTSEARVYADTRSILKPLLRGLAVEVDPSKELHLMVKTLLSRSNLETIARNVDANVRAKNSEEYEAIIKNLEDNIVIRSGGRENLYTISYSGTNAVYTKNVVQAALNVFVENTLSEQRLDTDNASQIIATQISEYESRLKSDESKLAEFKRQYQGFLPGSDSGYYSQLEKNKAALEDAQLALNEATTKFKSISSQMRKEEANAHNEILRGKTDYDDRINALQQRLDDLLFRYTDKHPDVIETRNQLADLQKLKEKQLQSYTVEDALENDPVYQDLKRNYSETENDVASLKVRVDNYQNKIAELQKDLDKVPGVEAQLTSLTRNYNITKEKYEQLLSRKESARISQSVGNSADDIKFRIIDPPRVPDKPSGPIRPLWFTGVLFVGLGAGVCLSLLISQISPVVSSTNQLLQLTGFNTYGVVSATGISGISIWEKRKTKLFILSNVLLILLFAVIVAISVVPSAQDVLV
ncbi:MULTISPECIES: XrtA system polysaccharide chain length determinant [Vibrio]|uniref:Chain length determinant family protein n=2 Tax=Vibrio TaxID=662 RepID=A0A7X4LPZ2_9VIBR|nr:MULTISPECIES: XrtA system polysaccharide chain length determinant [Vibrio]MBF9002162.1 chain length determinant family protein [Vibrio nitrifigilis]MZI95999.1 chain length determinant family protein [Vibrio eleionomae]